MSLRLVLLCFAPLVATACATLHGPAGPVMPDRPGFSDMPGVLPAGAVQVESGYTSDRDGATTYRTTGEALVRVGTGSGIELRMFGNSYAVLATAGGTSLRGMEDSKIGAKVRLTEQPDSVHGLAPTLAFLFATSLPTGAPGIGAGVAQPEAKLSANWTTSGPLSFAANLGAAKAFDGAAWSTLGSAVACTSFDVTEHLSLFVEGMRAVALSGPSPAATYVDGGVTVLLGDRLQLDAHIGRGISPGVSAERSFGFGVARRF
ncbi:MAG: transporter [Gemmatimonadales bacterium]